MIDFGRGTVTYDRILEYLVSPEILTIEDLGEELLQVEFPDESLLDLGWYPAMNPEGAFQLRVVKDYNWSAPAFLKAFRDIRVLPALVKSALKSCELG